MKKLLILLLLLTAQFAIAQTSNIKRTWHWYFGIFAGIDFSSGIALADTNGALATPEGCATMSDTSGNLLFYTNGRVVWNNSHDTMPHGSGLFGGANGSSTQAALIIPLPKSSNLFYLFTADEYLGTNGVRYSIIDMALDNGNGDVDTNNKNVMLFAPSTEKLSAINHCDDSSVWIVGHKDGTDEFYAYLLTEQGLNINPVISSSGSVISALQGLRSLAGQLKFSSDGRKAATPTNNCNWLELFDFNNETGVFSNAIVLSNNDTLNYGIEFSPNQQFLYNSTIFGKLFQYDISSNDSALIVDSKTLIHNYPNILPGYGSLQIASDGKIYIGSSQFIDRASVINFPDSAGSLCNYSDTSFSLNNDANRLGMPNFNCSYFRQSIGTSCYTNIDELQLGFINIFPNPARDWIVLEGKGIKSVEITNALGSYIDFYPTTAIAFRHQINLSSLSRGIYFLKINMIDERFQFQKLIVQN